MWFYGGNWKLIMVLKELIFKWCFFTPRDWKDGLLCPSLMDEFLRVPNLSLCKACLELETPFFWPERDYRLSLWPC